MEAITSMKKRDLLYVSTISLWQNFSLGALFLLNFVDVSHTLTGVKSGQLSNEKLLISVSWSNHT